MVLTRLTVAFLTSLSTENEYTLFYHVFVHYYITHHWKDWCWIWNSNTLATWCKELTHWKRPWCWERLKAGGEGDKTDWDGWMVSLTRWSWVWGSSKSWGWTGVLQSMGLQRVGHDWATEVNWGSANTDTGTKKEARNQCGTEILPSLEHRLAHWAENPVVCVSGGRRGSTGTRSACTWLGIPIKKWHMSGYLLPVAA